MDVIDAANKLPRGKRLPSDLVARFVGALSTNLRQVQKELINWLLTNWVAVDPGVLRRYYGLLLHRLNKRSPIDLLVELLEKLTNTSVVTQPRVNFLANLYARDPKPAISRLLACMRRNSPSYLYIPVTGQRCADDAQLPAVGVQRLASHRLAPLAPVYTQTLKALNSVRASDIASAEIVASLAPAVLCSQNLFLALEEFAYTYLNETWSGKKTETLVCITKLFKIWPHVDTEVLQKQLFAPIAARADGAAAVKVAEELIYLGPLARHLMDAISVRAVLAQPAGYVPVFHYYTTLDLVPPALTVTAMIVAVPGAVFLCEQWARQVPHICLTLQGQFSLGSDSSRELLPDIDWDSRFAFANSPWLGTYPHITLETLEIAGKLPALVTEDSMGGLSFTYQEFCFALLENLDELGVNIEAYLESADMSE